MSFDPLGVHKDLKSRGGIFELYHVTTYEGHRGTADGGEERVTVKILDAGPGARAGRYHCIVESESGRRATGNPNDDPHAALADVHWRNLDPHD